MVRAREARIRMQEARQKGGSRFRVASERQKGARGTRVPTGISISFTRRCVSLAAARSTGCATARIEGRQAPSIRITRMGRLMIYTSFGTQGCTVERRLCCSSPSRRLQRAGLFLSKRTPRIWLRLVRRQRRIAFRLVRFLCRIPRSLLRSD